MSRGALVNSDLRIISKEVSECVRAIEESCFELIICLQMMHSFFEFLLLEEDILVDNRIILPEHKLSCGILDTFLTYIIAKSLQSKNKLGQS